MEQINAIERLFPTQQDTAPAKISDQLGQQQFLELLVAQLENQDPSSPVDNGEFLTQIAQFSMVSGIGELEKSFTSLSDVVQRNQVANAAALLNKEVLYNGNSAELTEGGSISGLINLDRGASNVRLHITDTSGARTTSVNIGRVDAGEFSVQWDGQLDRALDSELEDDATAPAGRYRVTATGMVNGTEQSLPIQLFDRVESVTVDPVSRELSLQLSGGQKIALSNVNEFK